MKAELDGLAGSWTGITKTWLDPNAPPDEARVTATITAAVERWMRIAYTSTVTGKPHTGEMTWGFHNDPKQYEMTLIDTFHTGTAMMLSVGKEGATDIDVLGSYAAGPERWGCPRGPREAERRTPRSGRSGRDFASRALRSRAHRGDRGSAGSLRRRRT
jgi:hypothetical protein